MRLANMAHQPRRVGLDIEIESLARVAGKGAEEALLRIRKELATKGGPNPVEVLRRFKTACADGTFATPLERKAAARKPKRRQTASARRRRKGELARLRELEVVVALADLEERLAEVDAELAAVR